MTRLTLAEWRRLFCTEFGVVEDSLQVKEHEEREKEMDREVHVEVKRGGRRESKTNAHHGMQMRWREGLNELEPMWCDTSSWRTETNGALLCSLVQIVRVVIVRVIVDGVLGVTVVHIGHDEVLVIYVAIFVSDFLYLEMYSLHQMLRGPSLRLGIPIERLSIPQETG